MGKNKKNIIYIFIIFILSLVPFLWLKPGQAILGHDAGFPLSPWPHFKDRLFVWTSRFGLGNDQTNELGGFFIHGFEGLFDLIGFSLTRIQQITFAFYFFAFGIAMYLLANELFNKRKRLSFLIAVFYMFNHFILQAWFIVERTKFTLYIALPLLVLLIIKIWKNKIPPWRAALLGSLVIFFFNGGGFLPLYGSIIISLPLITFLLVIASSQKKQLFLKYLSFLVLWCLGSFLLNAYWIFPYIRLVMTSFAAEVMQAGGASGIISWVKTVSAHSSFYNLFRLQGIPEWYVNPLHPYAKSFLDNFVFYAFSHFIPLFAFLSLLKARNKIDKLLLLIFACLSLVAMIFVAGSHPPFGIFYLFLIKYLPGFIAFRTPFYKFAPALWFAFTILVGYTLDDFLEKFSQKKPIKNMFSIAIVLIVIAIYNYPFFLGNFFDYEINQKTTKVTVPEYVFEYGEWANSDDFPYQRLLVLPGQNPSTHFETYTWGYWSLAQIQGLLNNRSYITNSLYKTAAEEVFIKKLYELVEKEDTSWVDQAQNLFVDAILLRKDVNYQLENSETTNPAKIQEFIENDSRFSKKKEFDQWIIYELETDQKVFSLKDYYYKIQSQDRELFFTPITIPEINLDKNTVLVENDIAELNNRRRGVVLVPNCNHCALENKRLYPVNIDQVVTAGSIFYPIKTAVDDFKLNRAKSSEARLQKTTIAMIRRYYELRTQYVRQARPPDILKGWQSFNKSLNNNVLTLNEYLEKTNNKYGYQDNIFLSIIYENIEHIVFSMQTELEEVNKKEEVVLFMEADSLLENMEEKIRSQLWYSEDNVSKKYLIEVDNPGEYEIYLKKNTYEDPKKSQLKNTIIQIKLNNKVHDVDLLSLSNASKAENAEWLKLLDIELNKGANKFELVGEPTAHYLGEHGKTELDFSNNKKCIDYDVGKIEQGGYRFNLQASSNKDVDDLYVFLDKKGSNRVPFPYWGRKVLIEGNKETYLNFTETAFFPQEYMLRFCRLTIREPEDRNIKIKNLYYERAASPVLVFLQKSQKELPPPTNIKVNANKINQTKYELTLTGSGSSILMFDQRFNPNWQTKMTESLLSHQLIYGYANGWMVNKEKDLPETFIIEYDGQRLYLIGWLVSGLTFGTILLILGLSFLKKK